MYVCMYVCIHYAYMYILYMYVCTMYVLCMTLYVSPLKNPPTYRLLSVIKYNSSVFMYILNYIINFPNLQCSNELKLRKSPRNLTPQITN